MCVRVCVWQWQRQWSSLHGIEKHLLKILHFFQPQTMENCLWKRQRSPILRSKYIYSSRLRTHVPVRMAFAHTVPTWASIVFLHVFLLFSRHIRVWEDKQPRDFHTNKHKRTVYITIIYSITRYGDTSNKMKQKQKTSRWSMLKNSFWSRLKIYETESNE